MNRDAMLRREHEWLRLYPHVLTQQLVSGLGAALALFGIFWLGLLVGVGLAAILVAYSCSCSVVGALLEGEFMCCARHSEHPS